MGKIFLILGILKILLASATAIISLILPQMTRKMSVKAKRRSGLLPARFCWFFHSFRQSLV